MPGQVAGETKMILWWSLTVGNQVEPIGWCTPRHVAEGVCHVGPHPSPLGQLAERTWQHVRLAQVGRCLSHLSVRGQPAVRQLVQSGVAKVTDAAPRPLRPDEVLDEGQVFVIGGAIGLALDLVDSLLVPADEVIRIQAFFLIAFFRSSRLLSPNR